MSAISGRSPPVAVVYTLHDGSQRMKEFADSFKARRFYARCLEMGYEPQVTSVENAKSTMIARLNARLNELKRELSGKGVDLDTLHACCDRVAVLAQKKVLTTGTMAQMLAVDHPWVHEYFHGPRARAAQPETGG